jgi:hypothetical protein
MLKKRLLSKSRYEGVTLPDERYRTIVQTRKFLMELTSPHMTPKVPKVIRERARNLLKHYPNDYILEMMCEDMPDYFAKEIEPVTRMIMEYNRDRKNDQTL